MEYDKMKVCNRCLRKKGIHRWGTQILCDDCHNKKTKYTQSEDRDAEIKIPKETYSRYDGFYSNGDNEIYLFREKGIEATVNHEYMHHILNIRFNPQTSWNYDNIAKHIDAYHGFE